MDYEKLGVFYLGRVYDVERQQPGEELLLYDARDLVTHGLCVGMTGSGKTGLCLCILEEAALDGIPAIAIDPKGDLPNLLLTFPQLSADEFEPWVEPTEAGRKGLTPAEMARREAQRWREGLAQWDQDADRIRRLREAADFAIYTPGSSAGLPVSILRSFARPAPAVLGDEELRAERIQTTVSSLLGLVGIQVDPLRSREHILLSRIIDQAWLQRRDLDLPALIQQVQSPPIDRVGVLELEAFYPARERFQLAMLLNNLLAAPGFQSWLEGEPLDVSRMLYTETGRPRVSIFYVAHLSEAERMFFVSLLLNEVLGWVRSQEGTSSLRAILYMDEIYGYFPPVAKPPSKGPLLTLLKQARASGLGVLLATQNPVDLDYKGLSNTGTWFIGRLQTEQDKARLLDGLQGAMATSQSAFDRATTDRLLSGLGTRTFYLHNVHEDRPVVFQTRWAMSYLRGPLTRDQIRALRGAQPAPEVPQAAPGPAAPPGPAPQPTAPQTAQPAAGAATGGKGRPLLPPEVPQYFLPLRSSAIPGGTLVYEPLLLGAADVHFSDARAGADHTRTLVLVAPVEDRPRAVDWQAAEPLEVPLAELETSAPEEAAFAAVPAPLARAQSYPSWSRELADWLYRSERLELWRSPSLDVVSQPEESERDFRIRLQQAAREARDAEAEGLRQKYEPKLARLRERIRQAEQAVQREQAQARHHQMQTAISVGATLVGAFLGRKKVSATTVGRATTAARSASRVARETQDIRHREETLASLQQQLQELEVAFREETEAVAQRIDPLTEALETVSLRLRKKDIAVRLVGLAWAPYWQDARGQRLPGWG